ncbi:MAG: methyltransferase domain-containing protein [Patescibacteria group bacterium]
MYKRQPNPRQPSTSWGGVSHWYSDLVGESGHYFHQHLILPNVMKLLDLKPTDSLVDLGCGDGVMERSIPEDQKYLGIDIADALLKEARKKTTSKHHRFMLWNLTRPVNFPDEYTKAVCILALQNMANGQQCIQNAATGLKKDGQFILVLNHPCFRIPRQSSWGMDEKNKMQFRKINLYFSDLEIPIQMTPGKNASKTTWSYHHPLSTYFSWLKSAGFMVEDCQEWVSDKESQGKAAKMENRARAEIPLFLCLVARKIA